MTCNILSGLKSTASAVAIAMATLSTAGMSAAQAGVDVSISGNGFSLTPIKVISENGTSWTKIKEGTIGLPVVIGLGKTDHLVVTYSIRQLGQVGNDALVHPIEYLNPPIRIDRSDTLAGSTTHLSASERAAILKVCNDRLGVGNGINQTHTMFTGVGVELTGYFVEEKNRLDSPTTIHKGTGSVSVPVHCEGVLKRPDRVVAKEPTFKVSGIHLRFQTSLSQKTAPNPGTTCELTHARVRVETSKAGPVKFRLWTKVGNGPSQSQFVEAWSAFKGPGKFEAVFTRPIPVHTSTIVQAMAEDLVNSIGLSTGWKQVSVDCTGAGGGGLATAPSTANPDGLPGKPKPPKRVIDGGAKDLVGKPRPIHADPVPPRRPGIRPIVDKAPQPKRPERPVRVREAADGGSPVRSRVFGADRFERKKPHVN